MCASVHKSGSLKAAHSFTVGCILCDLETMSNSDRYVLNYNNSHKQDANGILLIHCRVPARFCVLCDFSS